MPKTLGVLRGDVRERLDETTAKFWSDTFLNRWINEGARDIARRVLNLSSMGTVAVTAGTALYTPSFAAAIYKIHGAAFQPTGSSQSWPVSAKDRQEMDAVWGTFPGQSGNTPRYFIIDLSPPSLTLTLFPVPSQNGTLTVYYYRLPTEAVNDNDTVDVVEGWWDLIEDYCEVQAKRKDGDASWKDAMQMYQDKMTTMQDQTKSFSDQGRMIMGTNGVGTMSWLYDFNYDL